MPSASTTQPLVILTRPAGTSVELIRALAECGFESMECPLFGIEAVQDMLPIQKAWSHLERYALVVFVSPTAIAYAWASALAVQNLTAQGAAKPMPPCWPTAVPIGVMGPGSLAALERHGVCSSFYKVIAPAGAENAAQALDSAARYDSQAFALAVEKSLGWDALRTKPVLIVRGDSGRDWLMHYMQSQGVQVDTVCAYKRLPCAPSAAQWRTICHLLMQKDFKRKQYWVLTSSTSMRELDALACTQLPAEQYARFKQLPFVTTHARVASCAKTLGFHSLVKPYLYGGSIIHALQAKSRSQNLS